MKISNIRKVYRFGEVSPINEILAKEDGCLLNVLIKLIRIAYDFI
jgi:hypothetical protein